MPNSLSLPFDWSALGAMPPAALASARMLTHHAAQWATKAARANLEAEGDESHASLHWNADHKALVSEPMATSAGAVRIGVRIQSLELVILRDAILLDNYPLEGKTHSVIAVWLDSALRVLGLQAASAISLPYTTPFLAEAKRALSSRSRHADALEELGRWYEAAFDLLQDFGNARAAADETGVPVRCSPRHLHIATTVRFEDAPDRPASLEAGMSPGDTSYGQPYFYLTPSPAPDPARLPRLPSPGRWHTEGFVAAIVTADDVLAFADRGAELRAYLDAACALISAVNPTALESSSADVP